MTNRLPQVKDVLMFNDQTYIIQAIVVKEDSIVLTQLGVPSSSAFVLKGAQLRWQDMLHAWRPVNVRDFFERADSTSD